jgi:predicted Zn-dependent peptidase
MLKQAPPIQRVNEIPVPKVRRSTLQNGIPIIFLEGGSQKLVRIDLQMRAGRPYEKKKLASTACASLLKEGTRSFAAKEIANHIDNLGAALSTPNSFDHIRVSLICLSKYFADLVPLITSMITEPVFPEIELELYKGRTIEKLKIDLVQNDILAYRKATELYFGPDHPYGYNSSPELYRNLDRGDLLHHTSIFGTRNLTVHLAGRPKKDWYQVLNKHLGKWNVAGEPVKANLPLVERPDDVEIRSSVNRQAAIRIGRRLFNRKHEDYCGMLLLNTILGGYFGSRLMRNIREEKGLTYGIQSAIETLKFDGYFSISCEADQKNIPLILDQIAVELQILCDEPVEESELQMAKNYLGGYLLSVSDGPFAMMDLLRSAQAEELADDYLNVLLQQIQAVTPAEIQRLAEKHLINHPLVKVVAY